MYIQQLYTPCLAEAAYYIESNGEAAIIDPIRETDPYLKLAAERGARIRYVFETHFHADFISGHVELAQATGAKIILGPEALTGYEAYNGHDGENFTLGEVTIKLLHTPGHTPESSTFLLSDKSGKPHCIFTGDTLFIGDVGRPDLAISSDITQDDLARQLFHSLRSKIMTLPNEVIVYPAHGAGSPCGKNISKETFDTLGNQKKTNYALQDISCEQFVELLTANIPPAPSYFAQAATLNRDGITPLSEVLGTGLTRLSVEAIEKSLSEGAILLDTRDKTSFVAEHIPSSIFIGLEGDFAPWAAKVFENLRQPLVFVAEPDREEEVVRRLARVGFSNCKGYLHGGLTTWKQAGRETSSLPQVAAVDLEGSANTQASIILDVRQPGEYLASHLRTALSCPLSDLSVGNGRTPSESLAAMVHGDGPVFIHCQGGYRSVIASSVLRRWGANNVVDVAGGFLALKQTACALVEGACSP
jgi:hydroxyacylglutathione hydrolase